MLLPILVLALAKASSATLTYSATYTPGVNLPTTSEQGQYGPNSCGVSSSNSSLCQNLYINSVQDFCLFGPPYSGANASIGETERIEVAYCLKAGYGTRLFPDGTILGAHFVQTSDYVQVTGWGDFTKIGLPPGDQGGELDPHGYDGNGNPIGGLVFGSSYGQLQQYHEWTNFMSANEFCIRACNPAGPNPAGFCEHVYDLMACEWNMPGNYDPGYFEDCVGDSGEPMGVYGTSTFSQGQPSTPPAHPAPSSSDCVQVASLASGSLGPTGVSVSYSTVFTTLGSTLTSVESVLTFVATTTSSTTSGTATSTSTGGSGTTSKAAAAGARLAAMSVTPYVAALFVLLGVVSGIFVAL